LLVRRTLEGSPRHVLHLKAGDLVGAAITAINKSLTSIF
jgi:hypothetical protein